MKKFFEETMFNGKPDFKKGDFLYMFMADVDGVTRCFGIGYTIQYAVIKGVDNLLNLNIPNLTRLRVNKVRTGECVKCDTFEFEDTDSLYEYVQMYLDNRHKDC